MAKEQRFRVLAIAEDAYDIVAETKEEALKKLLKNGVSGKDVTFLYNAPSHLGYLIYSDAEAAEIENYPSPAAESLLFDTYIANTYPNTHFTEEEIHT